MKGKKIKLFRCLTVGLLTIMLTITSFSKTPYTAPSYQTIAKLLRWIPAPLAPCSLCGGYFFEPKVIQENPNPAPYKKLPTKITAQGPAIFSKAGESILQKDVHVIQEGRLITADKAYIYRDKYTGKITNIKLVGHVHIQEHNKLLISNKARVNLKNNTGEFDHVVYRILQPHNRTGKNNGWGSAEKGSRLPDGSIVLHHATYSTCSPTHPTWTLNAKKLTFDHTKRKGVARGVSLKLGTFPIFYAPYLSFSINHQRKSGFLFPLIAHSTKSGFTLGWPFYWNMAPNYDMTITPTYFTKRGLQLNTLFRYISEKSYGKLYASYIPNDTEFRRFKNGIFAQFPEPISAVYQPYIDALRKSSNNRGYFAFNNHTKLGERWRLSAELNYVTDPYYFQDFGVTMNEVIANQLLNQLELNYEGMHWDFTFLTQAYQTLHLIDQANDPTVNQYMRLPELDTSADYPAFIGAMDFNLSMQAVNFAYHSAFPPQTNELPVGQRFHLRPTLTQSINWASGYFTPSLSLDSTTYNVMRPQPPQTSNSSRNLPIASIDTGLYFNRQFNFRDHDYFQTLEPRLFYLYVPYENQDQFPVYDTQLLPFTFSQLFALNRFTGFDRLQNANQVSFGLTSRILDADNANQLLLANIGIGYYIDQPRVCLLPDCTLSNERWTPLAAELTYYPTPHWAITGSAAWDLGLSQTNNAQVNVTYSSDGRHIIGAGYMFVHGQPSSPDFSMTSFSTNSKLYTGFIAWPLTERWSTVGYIYYNATEKRPESYFAGLEYDTCCIALRFIVSRNFLGALPMASGTQSINRYSTNYMFQLQLKGIGSAGNTNPYAMLESAIPGYRDPFKY